MLNQGGGSVDYKEGTGVAPQPEAADGAKGPIMPAWVGGRGGV